MKKIIIILCVTVLSGCSNFTPGGKPIIENKAHDWFNIKKTSIFATTASRRLAIVNLPDQIVCTEPSPDVAETLSRSFELLIKEIKKEPKNSDRILDLKDTLDTYVRTLFRRSQGAQVFRDGTFQLCQARANKFLSEEDFKEIFLILIETTDKLIQHELTTARESFYKYDGAGERPVENKPATPDEKKPATPDES